MKRYTAQEINDAILKLKAFQEYKMTLLRIEDMLRQAEYILDGIIKEIDIIEKMPTADLDGSFANQKVNGERLMAKISFYQKVKKIVGEVSNV